jgi:glycosyltransferase involved in cell wall biosynthesis
VLPGVVPHDAVARWLSAADVVAVPSVRDDAGNVDGLPNVVLEALASGTPVVATRAGGIPSVVTDGENGLLVAERDVAGLAAAIEQVLADRAFGSALGARARERAMREGSWSRVAERIEAVYDRAAGRHGVETAVSGANPPMTLP